MDFRIKRYSDKRKKLRGRQGWKFKNFRAALRRGNVRHMVKISKELLAQSYAQNYVADLINTETNRVAKKYRYKLYPSTWAISQGEDDFARNLATVTWKIKCA